MPAPRVILVDDSPEFLERAQSLLSKEFNVIGAFADGHAVLAAWRDLKPHAMVLDISMAPLDGIGLARRLAQQGYAGPIVFLTIHSDMDLVNAALAAGGSGYVLKAHMTCDLVPALRAVLSGERFLSPGL
jgi:DNA-binding NarL/FixJ family response regulator